MDLLGVICYFIPFIFPESLGFSVLPLYPLNITSGLRTVHPDLENMVAMAMALTVGSPKELSGCTVGQGGHLWVERAEGTERGSPQAMDHLQATNGLPGGKAGVHAQRAGQVLILALSAGIQRYTCILLAPKKKLPRITCDYSNKAPVRLFYLLSL